MAYVPWCHLEISETFHTLIAEPTCETWLEYLSYAALDEDEERVREFANNPEWKKMIAEMSLYFQRLNSGIMEEI